MAIPGRNLFKWGCFKVHTRSFCCLEGSMDHMTISGSMEAQTVLPRDIKKLHGVSLILSIKWYFEDGRVSSRPVLLLVVHSSMQPWPFTCHWRFCFWATAFLPFAWDSLNIIKYSFRYSFELKSQKNDLLCTVTRFPDSVNSSSFSPYSHGTDICKGILYSSPTQYCQIYKTI